MNRGKHFGTQGKKPGLVAAKVSLAPKPKSKKPAPAGDLAEYSLSKAGSRQERQADRTAASIMAMGEGVGSTPADGRQSTASAASNRDIRPSAAARSSAANRAAAGKPLPAAALDYFQPRFADLDLGSVRYRDDNRANLNADALGARAYTLGNMIAFGRGQFNSNSSEGKQLLAHELAHVQHNQQAGGRYDNAIFRETWNIDDVNQIAERGILVQLIFNDTYVDRLLSRGWTTARKTTFRSDFESSIENTFNNSSTALYPPASASDVLPQRIIDRGYRPRVDISLVPDGDFSVSEDWEVNVSSNPTSEPRTSSSNRSTATMDEADNAAVPKLSSAPGVTQIPSVHEFGHFIGLDHPGHGLSAAERSPGASEYGHTGADEHGHPVDGPNDLMGSGMGLRHFYFDEWAQAVDRHIVALREQRESDDFWRSVDEFFNGVPEVGDFPLPSGDTRSA